LRTLRARAACERLGATVVERAAPRDLPMSDMMTVLLTEMWVLHKEYEDRADRYRPAIRDLVDAARNATDATAYILAQERRADLTAEWEQWFAAQGVDVLLEPTVQTVAHVRGQGYDPGHTGGEADPLIALTATWDLTGFPVAALPAALASVAGSPLACRSSRHAGARSQSSRPRPISNSTRCPRHWSLTRSATPGRRFCTRVRRARATQLPLRRARRGKRRGASAAASSPAL
jgi:hypothetical protein